MFLVGLFAGVVAGALAAVYLPTAWTTVVEWVKSKTAKL
jgi:hypothetical protein